MDCIIFPQVKIYNILDVGDLEALKSHLSKIITCKNVLQLSHFTAKIIQLQNLLSPITKLPEELDVVAPKLNPEDAVLLLLAPDPNTNGGAAEPVLDVVAGLLSWGNNKDWDVLDSVELPKAELLTGLLACPNTKAATGGLEEEVELPNMPPLDEVAGALELEELLFKKLKTGFATPWSAKQ